MGKGDMVLMGTANGKMFEDLFFIGVEHVLKV